MKKLVIIDLRSILKDHYKRKKQHPLFRLLSAELVIESLLSVNYYIDYSDIVYNLIDSVINEASASATMDIESTDVDAFDLLVEALVVEVDKRIADKTHVTDGSYYLFDRWLGESSVVLEICHE